MGRRSALSAAWREVAIPHERRLARQEERLASWMRGKADPMRMAASAPSVARTTRISTREKAGMWQEREWGRVCMGRGYAGLEKAVTGRIGLGLGKVPRGTADWPQPGGKGV